MKGRVRWSRFTIALALIAALAIAAPAIGGPSLKKLVKKEVAKQIAKATGPAGPPGPSGINGSDGADGIDGADGTARAYAMVQANCAAGTPEVCDTDAASGVTGVTRPSTGQYCITAPGISPDQVSAAVTVEWGGTAAPEGNASAMTVFGGGFVVAGCPDETFVVNTDRHGATTDAVPANDVWFTIVIP